LKALSPDAEPAAVASLVLDSCPDIPRQKLEEIEQLVFYLQKRLVSSGDGMGFKY
jgi:hypothetical protein